MSTGAPDFETYCMPHWNELYGAAMRMTRQPADAHDLVQDTLLRALAAWSRFEPGSNCRAWLFRILTNSFINDYRKRRRHKRLAAECPEDTVAAIYGDAKRHADPAERRLVDHSLGDEVTRALDALGDDQRRVVEMADLGDVRYRDIAQELDLPLGTVMSRLFRARRQLEKQLSGFAAADYGIHRAA